MRAPRPKRPRPPRLVRVTTILKRASMVVFILFVLYMATVAYSFGSSAFGIHGNGGSHNGNTGFNGTSTITTWQQLNVTNSGLYPATFGTGLVVYNASGVVFGSGSTPATTISRGDSAELIFGASLSVASGSPGQVLLTQSQTLQFGIWVNVTTGLYLLVPFMIHITQNQSWGAPFTDATATAGVVGSQTSVTFAFDNNASFSLGGTMAYQVRTPGGASCGSGSFDVNTPEGQSFTYTVPTSCTSLTGDSFVANLSNNGGQFPYSVDLPAIPVRG